MNCTPKVVCDFWGAIQNLFCYRIYNYRFGLMMSLMS